MSEDKSVRATVTSIRLMRPVPIMLVCTSVAVQSAFIVLVLFHMFTLREGFLSRLGRPDTGGGVQKESDSSGWSHARNNKMETIKWT